MTRAHQSPVPRRSCRQPAAPRGAEGGAGQAREGRDHAGAAQGGRGSRDREGHQEAGGGRAQARDRRRVPPLLVAVRFLQGARRRRALPDRPRHRFCRASQTKAESVRVVGKVGFSGHPASRAFPLRQGSRQGHAEDDHPGALARCTSARAGSPSASRSIPTSRPISTMSGMAYRKAIRAFYDAGCRYLQLDDTAWSMICDPKEREHVEPARRRSRPAAGAICPA